MNTLSREEWTSLNQQYLLGALRLIRQQLAAYREGKEAEEAIAQNRQELDDLAKRMPVEPALRTVSRLFKLSTFEEQFLVLCAGIELDTAMAKEVLELAPAVTFGLALSALAEGHWSAISPNEALRYWHLIKMEDNRQLTNAPCSIDEHILHFLLGISQLDHYLDDLVTRVSTNQSLVPSHQRLSDELSTLLPRLAQQGTYPIIQVQGGSRPDNIAIVHEAFSSFHMSTFQLQLSLLPRHTRDLKEFIRRWNRTALLNNFALYLDGAQVRHSEKAFSGQLTYLLEHVQGVVVFGGDLDRSVLSRSVISFDARRPEVTEQAAVWREALGPLAETLDGDIENLTTQFNLDTHSIRNLAKLTQCHLNGNNERHEIRRQIWQICCAYTRPTLDQLGQRINPRATWEDLVLPEAQKDLLRQIAVQVQQRQTVYHSWGFAGKSNRGLGITALFSGESGTGKTMASEVLANALQLDLYRIDLSQVVNKYIGETEKNLKKIFDAAEGSGAILLFDEADALFGKRSEVKDSHDRYSNIEVSYLLQKMEEYKGLAILTTNMKNALDKAFLRRIRFVVQFPFPDVEMRAAIWQRIFPKQTPTVDLDVNKLAGLNVAGGNIKNIALNASFLAAGKYAAVSMEDIQAAAKNEYLKLDKQMSTSESLI